jgi:hypothetical protein
VAEVRRLGAAAADVSGLPGNRLLAVARYGVSAKAPALRDLAEQRRKATLSGSSTAFRAPPSATAGLAKLAPMFDTPGARLSRAITKLTALTEALGRRSG